MSDASSAARTALNVLDWITDGCFPAIGQRPTRSAVLQALGEPQHRGAGKAYNALWCYGAVEFHFAQDGAVRLIHIDNFVTSSDAVDLWILPKHPTISQLETELSDRDVDVADFEVPAGTGRKLSTGVEFYFNSEGVLNAVSQRFDTPHRRRQISVELDEHHFEMLRRWSGATQRSMSSLLSEVARAALDAHDGGPEGGASS